MKFKEWLSPIVYLGSNWISLIGVILVTTAALLFIFLLPTAFRGHSPDPYVGILQFMLLPAVFFAGLGLIPLGIWWFKKRNKDRLPAVFPPVDFSNPRFRRLLAFLGATTVANVVIGGALMYKAVSYMESVSFCGQTCHVVMKPEFTAYQNSPHSRVECVSCHIGPGANWFVKSKISGVLAGRLGHFRPVSAADSDADRESASGARNVRGLPLASEVWRRPDQGRSTISPTMSRPSARNPFCWCTSAAATATKGIHGAHMGPGVKVRYAHSDKQRQKIPWVEYTGKDGKTFVFKAEGFKGDGPGGLETRTMDCMDCHNRPSHTYELPERALNRALASGEVDLSLPFVRKVALETIKQEYKTDGRVASERFRARFTAYYEKNHPAVFAAKKDAIARGGKSILAVFERTSSRR